MAELVRLAGMGIFQKKSYRDRKEYFKDTAKMLSRLRHCRREI